MLLFLCLLVGIDLLLVLRVWTFQIWILYCQIESGDFFAFSFHQNWDVGSSGLALHSLYLRDSLQPQATLEAIEEHNNLTLESVLGPEMKSLLLCRYLVKELVGCGTFGQVAKCLTLETNEYVAVKVIKNQPAYSTQAKVEIGILHVVLLYPYVHLF